MEKRNKNFPLQSPSFVCRAWSVSQSAPIPRNCSVSKNSWLRACNFQLTILDFANLPIYRKLIYDYTSLVFWKPRIFCLVIFGRRYIIFIIKYWPIIIFVSVILKKIKITLIPIIHVVAKNSKGYSSNSSSISDYNNIVEITSTQHYTRIILSEQSLTFESKKQHY